MRTFGVEKWTFCNLLVGLEGEKESHVKHSPKSQTRYYRSRCTAMGDFVNFRYFSWSGTVKSSERSFSKYTREFWGAFSKNFYLLEKVSLCQQLNTICVWSNAGEIFSSFWQDSSKPVLSSNLFSLHILSIWQASWNYSSSRLFEVGWSIIFKFQQPDGNVYLGFRISQRIRH